MYAFTYKGVVFLTPQYWNTSFINTTIRMDYDVDANIKVSDETRVPFDINEDIRVYKVTSQYPESIDTVTERLEGPFWTITQNEAIATYTKVEKPLELIKTEFKAKLAEARYLEEIKGTKTTIQGVEITVDTARGTRDIFIDAYVMMGNTDTRKWKFPETWLTLTKSELGQAVAAGAHHVQSAFDWEEQVTEQLELKTTAQQVKELHNIVFAVEENHTGF